MENLMVDFAPIKPQYDYPKWACSSEPFPHMFTMVFDIISAVEKRDDRVCRYLLSDTGALYNLIIMDYTEALSGFSEHKTREERVAEITKPVTKARVNLLHTAQHKRLARTLLEDYPTALFQRVRLSTENVWNLYQLVSLVTNALVVQHKEFKFTYINLVGDINSREIETQATIAHVSFDNCDGV